VCATPISVASQALGVALACEDGAEHLHTRLAGHSADHLSQLAMHLLQSFLPMLDSARGAGNEETPLPQGAAQPTDLIFRTKGTME
jgi:hypothetical protein